MGKKGKGEVGFKAFYSLIVFLFRISFNVSLLFLFFHPSRESYNNIKEVYSNQQINVAPPHARL